MANRSSSGSKTQAADDSKHRCQVSAWSSAARGHMATIIDQGYLTASKYWRLKFLHTHEGVTLVGTPRASTSKVQASRQEPSSGLETSQDIRHDSKGQPQAVGQIRGTKWGCQTSQRTVIWSPLTIDYRTLFCRRYERFNLQRPDHVRRAPSRCILEITGYDCRLLILAQLRQRRSFQRLASINR